MSASPAATEPPIDLVRAQLLDPAAIDLTHLEKNLADLMDRALDYGDLYLQHSRFESWTLEDGIVKDGVHSVEQGIGVRAVVGERTGFAYSDDLRADSIRETVAAARTIARAGQAGRVQVPNQSGGHELYGAEDPIDSLADEDKVATLGVLDGLARARDPRVEQVIASLAGVHELVLVLASDGTLVCDVRPLTRINLTVIMQADGRREQGFAGGGGRADYSNLSSEDYLNQLVSDAIHQAETNLEAIPAPAGAMPVVLGAGWPGVLLHEAIGHGLEGDFNRKGTSAFSGRVGEQVASSVCTVVDDGTLPGRRGSLGFDDEGHPTQCNTLIENGVLKGYMQDKLNGRLMKTGSTGNGRRESFAHVPMPRMTNTYMLPGASDPDEIIESVDQGIYAPNFGGGQVDITSGKFVFAASEAYLIEKGRIGAPIKGAMLIGNGPDVLTKVSMVGNDMRLDPGVGVCGKEGQSVPVGVGQPSLRIDELTVGGTDV